MKGFNVMQFKYVINNMNSILATSFEDQAIQPRLNNTLPVQPSNGGCDAPRKRLFSRKPGLSPALLLAEKRRKDGDKEKSSQEAVLDNIKSWRQRNKDDVQDGLRYSESSASLEGKCKQENWSKEIFYNPTASHKQLILDMRYIHKPQPINVNKTFNFTVKEATEAKEVDQKTDVSQEVSQVGHETSNYWSQQRVHDNPPLKKKKDSNKADIFRMQAPNPNIRLRQEQAVKSCERCKKNQQKYQKLSQRTTQLELQIVLKNRIIKDLNDKNELMITQKQRTEKELGLVLQELQQRTRQSELDLSCTFQRAKKEISKLNDKIKYMQIQNGMLLRYKQQFMSVVKESDKLRYQNANLKRQLITIAKMDDMDMGFSRQVNKRGSKNKMISRNKEEDMISLDLSEWSTQQF